MASNSYNTLRFDQVVRKHTHNSYQRDESLFDQALYNMVRSLELDIHLSKDGHTEQGNWFVYHTTKQESDTTCRTLSDGLARLSRYHDRLQRAARMVSEGDHRFIASPIVDSYHSIWFELHEDLILLAGRTRADEVSAGRA